MSSDQIYYAYAAAEDRKRFINCNNQSDSSPETIILEICITGAEYELVKENSIEEEELQVSQSFEDRTVMIIYHSPLRNSPNQLEFARNEYLDVNGMAHQINPVDGELADLLNKTFTNHARPGYVKVDGVIMPESYKIFPITIEDFKVRDDDVWVCSLPKAGTTWTQEMVWCIANDLDFERAKVPLTDRFPFFELSYLIGKTENTGRNRDIDIPEHTEDSVSYVEKFPSPRFIKTHLPFKLLPQQLRTGQAKPKIIYIYRNAKDTCISYFHHCKLLYGFRGNFEDFCTLYLGDTVTYAPFWKHVLGYWNKKDDDNVLFLKYDDMKMDLPSTIKRTATFLNKNLTNDQVSALVEHLSFSSMKKNPAVNNEQHVADVQKVTNVKQDGKFMRSGSIEQWKTVMNPEFIQRFDDWTQKNLRGTSLSI